MVALEWLIAIVLGLMALVGLVGAFIASIRSGQVLYIVLCILLSAAGGAALWSGRPSTLGLAAVVVAAGSVGVIRRVTRNTNHATQTAKLSGAHLVLIAGSFLFLIPFGWLISTSLKTDEEQAVFPPVWIPTQQVTTPSIRTTEGKPAGLSWLSRVGGRVRVAEVEDLPSGDIKVRVIGPSNGAGTTVVAKRSDLTRIRRVGPRWQNYAEALQFLPPSTHYGLVFLKNTLILTLVTLIGTLISSSMVAYSFARLKWPGRDLLFVVLLATMMVPGAITMMPQFLIFRSLHWIDTLYPLCVPAFFGSAFNIFLLRQFFMSIPGELEDAAKLDGCGPFTIYWRIMLPLVKPALAAIAIMSVMASWNNFMGPLIYLSSPEKMPLAYALQLYQQQHGGEPGLLMAASTLVVLPIIILFFFTQRYFIEGASLTGLGGR